MIFYIVVETNENPIGAQYEPIRKHSNVFKGEAELEKEFIKKIC